MSSIDRAGTFVLGDRIVKRVGYGAMQLAGPGVFGPPRDTNDQRFVIHLSLVNAKNFLWRVPYSPIMQNIWQDANISASSNRSCYWRFCASATRRTECR